MAPAVLLNSEKYAAKEVISTCSAFLTPDAGARRSERKESKIYFKLLRNTGKIVRKKAARNCCDIVLIHIENFMAAGGE